MGNKSEIHFVKVSLSMLFYKFELLPHKVAEILECAIKQATNFTFEHATIDRTNDRNEFTRTMLIDLRQRIDLMLSRI